jgi:hypothetical protein
MYVRPEIKDLWVILPRLCCPRCIRADLYLRLPLRVQRIFILFLLFYIVCIIILPLNHKVFISIEGILYLLISFFFLLHTMLKDIELWV